MKKILVILFLYFFSIPLTANAGFVGSGEVQMSEGSFKHFVKYVKGSGLEKPGTFVLTTDGQGSHYWYCPHGNCDGGYGQTELNPCELHYKNKVCKIFAKKRYVVWRNGINKGGKQGKINSRWSEAEIRAKLTELGFLGGTTSKTTKVKKKKVEKKKETKKKTNNLVKEIKDLNDSYKSGVITKEEFTKAKKKLLDKKTNYVTKKKEKKKKLVKKYSMEGKKSIALSWNGYSDLIAGTVKFNETNYKGTISLSLPNDDGDCEGNYSLQENGKGTWQISCTNNMGAAGTLKWIKDGATTGIGRDHKDKKVKFTVSKKG